ncbi:MAG: nucleotidyl transferase AbiEii/AbiGii toxin family protein [Bacteroidota bacterium]|nr:nucleotidyl transferase AbiEii/AbiGii toxin family protein [Bacteroidota bacterium]
MKSGEPKRSKQIKDLTASVKTRLLNIAKQTNRDFNAVLLQYFQERFLYRLSISQYQNGFILKGALLLLTHRMSRLRPTRDIDFLGQGISNAPDNIEKIMQEIVAIDCEDGVIFDPKTVTADEIIESADYQGVRVRVEATLGGIKEVLWMDVAFGDKIVGGPYQTDFPVLLEQMPVPKISVYSIESSIAEKFESLVKLSFVSSRMKDIYDILFQAENVDFLFDNLREAIIATFQHRRTPIEDRSVIFSNDFKQNSDKQKQWKAFLSRNRLTFNESFLDVINKLELFLEPVCTNDPALKNTKWDNKAWRWKRL